MRNFPDELKAFEGVLGFDPLLVEQGSVEWLKMRLGVITASKIDCVLAKSGTEKRNGYINELVAEICTASPSDMINAKALSWGKDNESLARDAYEMLEYDIVGEVAFIYKDNSMRCGCSPDGIIYAKNKGLELKCPFSSKVYIDFLTDDKIKPEYVKQVQYSMWVSGLDVWDFANFDPRMRNCKKLHCVTIERDQKTFDLLNDAVPQFIHDTDKKLAKAGVKFGQQWHNYEV